MAQSVTTCYAPPSPTNITPNSTCTSTSTNGNNNNNGLQFVTKTKKVFVGGVATNTTVEELREYFAQFGKVSERERVCEREGNWAVCIW